VARGANRSAHGSGWLLNAAAGVRFAPSGLTRGRLPKPRRGRPDRRVDEGPPGRDGRYAAAERI